MFPFTISEFCITKAPIPQNIADKILKWHILPMLFVRKLLNDYITASKRSGYRPVRYELLHRRLGGSQHCFKKNSKGAVDWTTRPSKISELLDLIIKHTKYTRIAYNKKKNFIHCDYKVQDGKRYYFEYDDNGEWKFVKFIN